MKSALVALPLDLRGGAESVLHLVARTLSKRADWEVELAFLGGPTRNRGFDPVSHVNYSYGSGGGKIVSELLLIPRLASKRYDLVLSSHARLNAFLSLARRIGLCRCERLVARESTVLLDRYGGPRAQLYKWLYRLYGCQDMIVAQTNYMRERLKEVLPQKAARLLTVVPNPVDHEWVRQQAILPLSEQDEAIFRTRPQVVWCGRMIDVKDPLLAVDVLTRLRQATRQDYGLLMVGTGPMEEQIRDYAAAAGMGQYVTFAGQRDNPFQLFRASRAGVLTSRMEGFPNVLLEMMACGVRGIAATPCAGDLGALSGVEISLDFEARSVAEALSNAIAADRSANYVGALDKRSANAFVDRILEDG